jgi:DNA invertase Pin-like site-specific DNA recombinase
MIAAIYARRSTDQRHADAEAKSVAVQVEHARAFAREHGWTVAEDHIYADEAVSGADTRRLYARQRLLDAIDAGPPFQILIMRERSRFSRRDGDEAFGELKKIARAGVAVWFYQDRSPFAFGTFGENIVGFVQAEGAAEYRRQIAAWTYTAMARKARAGHVAGGRLFGYDNVRVDGHVERRINPAEAAVVLEIFHRGAGGTGLKTITKALNDAGALAPQARRDRPGTWSPSSVRDVLHRDTYRGVLTWNRTKKRDADGQKRQHARPAAEWVTVSAEALRIVPEPLWRAVHDRLQQRQASAIAAPPLLTGRGVRQQYFLTGFGRCVHCGGSMQAVSRASSVGRNFRYVCATYWNRGVSVCSNGMMVDMPVADAAVRDLLRAEVLQPRIVTRAIELAAVQAEQEQRDGSRVLRLRQRLAGLTVELSNLAQTAAHGGAVPAVLELLTQRDQERRLLAADLASEHRRVRPVLSSTDLRQRLQGFLLNWHALLDANRPEARAVLDGVLADRIRFEPESDQHQYRLIVPIAFDRVVCAAVPELTGFTRNSGVPKRTARYLGTREYVRTVDAA